MAEPFFWDGLEAHLAQTGVERESQLISQSNYHRVSDSQSKPVKFNEHPGGEFSEIWILLYFFWMCDLHWCVCVCVCVRVWCVEDW